MRPPTVWKLYLWLMHVVANGGYAGDKLLDALVEVGDVRIAPLGGILLLLFSGGRSK